MPHNPNLRPANPEGDSFHNAMNGPLLSEEPKDPPRATANNLTAERRAVRDEKVQAITSDVHQHQKH
ncbi:MAG: hypothetical protein ACYC5Y_06020 [Symbiobacteriia bacterium]